MRWRKSPGKRPNPLSAYSPAFRHGAIALRFVIRFVPRFVHGPMFRPTFRPTLHPTALCFAIRFVPWPHTHGLIFRHVATTPFITSGRIQAVSRGDSRPGSAERTIGPEAIDCLNPGNGARRRLIVRVRATRLRDDWLSGPDRTTNSGAIRGLDPIERSEFVKKPLLRGILQADPALTAKISEVRGYCAGAPAMKHFVKHARPGETRHTKEPPMPIELKSAQIHSDNPLKRRYFVNEAALCLRWQG